PGSDRSHPDHPAGRAADPDRLRHAEDARRMEGLRRRGRRRLARDDLPRLLQRPDPEGRDRRAPQDAAGAQPGARAAEGAREGRRQVSATGKSEVLALTGALSFETIPEVLAQSAEYAAREDLPDSLTIDFAGITSVD